ncbi:beta-ketoacyl synthase N-terminal-like domain-containing protein [Staphylococcus cohnii]
MSKYIEMLYDELKNNSSDILFTFIKGSNERKQLTAKNLLENIDNGSDYLSDVLEEETKILLLLPKAEKYLYGLLSCWKANKTAIVVPINSNLILDKDIKFLNKIINNSNPQFILTERHIYNQLYSIDKKLSFVDIDSIVRHKPKSPNTDNKSDEVYNRIAMITYTSGSTSNPKGLQFTHENVYEQAIAKTWRINKSDNIVSWLPHTHAFGMFTSILTPLIKQAHSVIIPIEKYLRKPSIWFENIEKYKATISPCLNFSFDYTVEKLVERKSFNLKSIEALICAGEPIRENSWNKFYENYKKFGIKYNNLLPLYGMTEVCPISSELRNAKLEILNLNEESFKTNHIQLTEKTNGKKIISCGKAEDIDLKVYDSERNRYCLDGEIGEIYVKSPRIADNYYNEKKDLINEKGYFNTEDLGFLYENNLYIIGRTKEIIIINGKNYYPQDIENEIKLTSKYIKKVAVFSVEEENKEHICVVLEMYKINSEEYEYYTSKIYQKIKKAFGLKAKNIVIVKSDTIPITNSGKVQRLKCKQNFVDGNLSQLYNTTEKIEDFEKIIKQTLVDNKYITSNKDLLNIDINELDLNSLDYYKLAEDISVNIGKNIKTIDLFKFPRIVDLIEYIKETNSRERKSESFEENSKAHREIKEDVAIVGMDFKFPNGIEEKGELWNYLYNGKSAIKKIKEERPEIIDLYEKQYRKDMEGFTQFGGFLKDYKLFDARFFNISRIEAESMDPQQRLLLQSTWKAIEDSGNCMTDFSKNKVGVFVGAHSTDYSELINTNIKDNRHYGAYIDTGLHATMLSNRISRWYNFKGPSETINTACSSSLVAINRAVVSIQNNECDIAIVSGVNMILSPKTFVACEDANMLSKDGKCKTLDNEANGFVRSEGCGTLILKSLKDVNVNKEHVYGVIKGVCTNHDGRTNSLRAPSLESQTELLRTAYNFLDENNKIPSYIEMHGTGTRLGDPIEYEALNRSFNYVKEPIKMGSIKTNLGHMESAAGIAGIIKVLLCFEKRIIPKLHNFKELNKEINFNHSKFKVPKENEKWNTSENKKKLAGVSSFGVGGSNAHVILEEFDNTPKVEEEEEFYIIPLYAHKQESLVEISKNLITFIEHSIEEKGFMKRLAYTLQTGRTPLKVRVLVIVKNSSELIEFLKKLIDNPDNYIGKVEGNTNFKNEIIYKWKQREQIKWENYIEYNQTKILNIPTYPFIGEEYWINSSINEREKYTDKGREAETLKEELQEYIKEIYSEVSKIPKEDIKSDTNLEEYGIDSIIINKTTKKLQERFPELSVTMLFECKTITDISNYLFEHYNFEKKEATYNKLVESNEEKDEKQYMCNESINNYENISEGKNDIAIIGLAGEYPEAENIEEFWDNLKNKKDSVKQNNLKRWKKILNKEIYGEKNNQNLWGGYLRNPLKFDAEFFGITPNEAYSIEPEERLFLQTVYNALEDSGYTKKSLEKKEVGVYVGSTFLDSPIVGRDLQLENEDVTFSGSASSIANRVSYFFDFKGPSIALDTMCSSSISALHLACQSLKLGEIEIGVVGGVNLNLHPNKYNYLNKYNFLSETGKCKSFSEDGDGYTPGEGVGAILIKDLSQAIRDKDNIYGIIKGTSINHGGKNNGFYVPNPLAQSKLIKNAIVKAGIDSKKITYIEAHGTGTSLGDPIEISGLTKALDINEKTNNCAIGSVKSNIGHLEAAAGISGITKVLLQMKHKQIVPSLHAQSENKHINFNETPFYIQKEISDWKGTKNKELVAGISSFGAGGSNAHVIIQDYKYKKQAIEEKREKLILISAKSQEQVLKKCQDMISFLQNEPKVSLEEIEYTLAVGREHFNYRIAVITTNLEDLIFKLNDVIDNPSVISNIQENEKKNINIIDINWHKIIEEAFSEYKLKTILEIWKLGIKVDWEVLLKKQKRISLPGYPFEEITFHLNPNIANLDFKTPDIGLYISEWIRKK